MIRHKAYKLLRPWSQLYSGNEFLKKFISILGVDILVKVSGFILIPIFLLLMSQSEFGVYNYLLAIINTFSIILNFGLYIPQTKLYHSYSGQREKGILLFNILMALFLFMVTAYVIAILTGFDVYLVSVLFDTNPGFGKYRELLLFCLAVSVISFMLTNFFYISEKLARVKSYNIYRIVLVNIVALLVLYFIPGDKAGIRLQATYFTEMAIILLFAWYLIKEIVPVLDKKLMWKCILMGFPVMLSAVFGIAVNFSDKYLLQRYGTLEDLSNYFLAFSFASIIPLVFASLQNVWLPVFMKEKDLNRNYEKTKRLLKKMILFFFPLAAGIWILFVIMLWIGFIPEKYQEVTWILPILLVTQIVSALTPIFSNYLVYFEKTQYISYSGLLMSAVAIVTGLLVIPEYGIYGAGFTTLLVNTLYLFFYYFLVMNMTKKLRVASE